MGNFTENLLGSVELLWGINGGGVGSHVLGAEWLWDGSIVSPCWADHQVLETEVLDGSLNTDEVVNLGISLTISVSEVGFSHGLVVIDNGVTKLLEAEVLL